MLYDSVAVQRFVGLTARGPRPDETTILNFRHLLEEHQLGEGLLAEITHHLAAQGLRLREGTIVDATILDAPASTKNRAQGARPGDASGEEGQSVVLRDEGAHRGGCGHGAGAQRRDDGGPTSGRSSVPRNTASSLTSVSPASVSMCDPSSVTVRVSRNPTTRT